MRDVFREVVKYNAHKFICVHNHPTGDPSPSEQDVITTKEIFNTSKIMGIKFMDHIIIGDNCYFSFKESSTLLDQ
jgi:DNA repair protein RadC